MIRFHPPAPRHPDHGLRVAAASGFLGVVAICAAIYLISGAADGGWMDALADATLGRLF